MKELMKELQTLFSKCETLPECHNLHVEILGLLDKADSDRRNEIIKEEK